MAARELTDMTHDVLPGASADGRVRRARARRDATRRALVAGSARVFARVGYLATSPQVIAEEAGVTRATFYQHFAAKADAFSAVLDDVVDRLQTAVLGVDLGPQAPTPLQQLTNNLLRVLDILLGDRDLARLLLTEAAAAEPQVQLRAEGFFGSVRAMIRDALLDGREVDLVRPVHADLCAHALLGAVKAVLIARLEEADGQADGQVQSALARELLAFCLCGVASDALRAAVLAPVGQG